MKTQSFVPTDHEEFLTPNDISKRWHCHPDTAKTRLREAGFQPIRFNQRAIVFRLSDVRAVENVAQVRQGIAA